MRFIGIVGLIMLAILGALWLTSKLDHHLVMPIPVQLPANIPTDALTVNPQTSSKPVQLTVCPEGPPTCQFGKIQAAIDAASEGSIILINPGEYTEELKITKSLTLWGAGPEQTIVKGVWQTASPVTLSILAPPRERTQIMVKGLTLQASQEKSSYAVALLVGGSAPDQLLQLQLNLWQNHISGVQGIYVGALFAGAIQLNLWENTITSSLAGIVSRALGQLQFFMQGNTIQMQGGTGLYLFNAQASLVGERIEGATTGVILHHGQASIQESVIRGNGIGILLEGGSVLDLSKSDLTGNQEYGLVIEKASCFPGATGPLSGDKESSYIQGVGNTISGNGKADLCPSDYPWPPGFMTQTPSSKAGGP